MAGASNDAESLARTLTQYAGFPEDQIVLLTSNQPEIKKPDRNTILDALRNLRDQVKEDGLLLVAFACHGVEREGRQYLLPSDAKSMKDVASLEDSAISVETVKRRIDDTHVRQVIFILDTCRNDPRRARGDGDNPLTAGFSRSFNFNLRNSDVEAYATLYAASVGERALEYVDKKQGYFMWSLIEGIKGGAANERGEVTLSNLVYYVGCRVPRLVLRDYGASTKQKPWAVIEGSYTAGELVISSVGRAAPRTGECDEQLPAREEVTAITAYSQSAGVKLTASHRSIEVAPKQVAQFSYVLTNEGEKEETFLIQADLPTGYEPSFDGGQGTSWDGYVLTTPKLKRGEPFKVVLNVLAPETSTGGQQRRFFVSASPQSLPEDVAVVPEMLKVKAQPPPVLAAVPALRATATPPPVNYSEPASDLQLALRRLAVTAQPGQDFQLSLTVTNTGNKEDQFRLETDLPAEYRPSFSQSGTDTRMPVFVTPQLQRSASLEVVLNARVPESAPDNQQQRFLVRAASQTDATVTKVADASLTVAAAALAVASNALQETVQPGDTFTQRISVRNQGSATARVTRADFILGSDFELVSATPSPISYDRPSRTAVWSLGDLESRDNREIMLTLRAVPEALAGANKPVGRGTMYTQSLFLPSNFEGAAITVGRLAGARVEAVSKGQRATPGDRLFLPFIVRNPSNYAESFDLRIVAPGAPQATVYADTNGDGLHQAGEPEVKQTAALNPRGGQYPVLLGVDIPRSATDRTQFAYNLVVRAMNAPGRIAGEDSTVLMVATPRVRVRFELLSSRRASFAIPFGPAFIQPVGWQQDDARSQAEQGVFNRGRELFNKRQYEQAAAVFRDFLKKNPDSFIADLMLLWLGRSYIELGKFTEAAEVAERLRAIEDTPFSDIYESELQTASARAPQRPVSPAAMPTPTPSRPEAGRVGGENTGGAGPQTKPGEKGMRGDAAAGASLLERVVPGETINYRLVLVNDGGGVAKNLLLVEETPDALEFISSSPELTLQDLPGGRHGLVLRVAELGPGATTVLQVTVRARPNIASGASVTPRHTLTYQDLNSNSYREL